MKMTTREMTKGYNNKLFLCDCTHITDNIYVRDRHVLESHSHTPELINQFINDELWHEWKNKYFTEV